MEACAVGELFIGGRGLAHSAFGVSSAAAAAPVDKLGLINVCGSRCSCGLVDVVRTKQRSNQSLGFIRRIRVYRIRGRDDQRASASDRILGWPRGCFHSAREAKTVIRRVPKNSAQITLL
jgi:hypothetical protein